MCKICRPVEPAELPPNAAPSPYQHLQLMVHPVRHLVQTTPKIPPAELKKGKWYLGYELNRLPGLEAFFIGRFEEERKRSRGYCKYKISPSTYEFKFCKVHSSCGIQSLRVSADYREIKSVVDELCQEWEVRARVIDAESFFAERRGFISACGYCDFYELPVNDIMRTIRYGLNLRTNGVAINEIYAGVSKYLGGSAYQERLANRYVHAQFARVPGGKRIREES